jgi:DNA-binding NtrC family response regulator
MAGTVKESSSRDTAPLTRLLTVVLHYDDALTPPALTVPWSGAKVVFGRGEADRYEGPRFTLKDPRVSTDHAELQDGDSGPVLRDLGSSNGSWINGVRVDGKATLATGDLIELGRTVLVYREAPASQATHVLSKTGATLGALRTLNPELGDIYRRLAKIAATTQPALIVGETGTGKDVVANELHKTSGRAGPFVAVDCGAVPDSLFESTLFGHERGAFTGATEPRVGEITRAQKGTLLLDEVGNLTPIAQAKLLRVLETSKVTPLGGTRTQDLDVRWLAATNRFLMQEGDDFRSDLLHRLAGFVVTLPALRRRREDLGLLIAHLLRGLGVTKASVAPPAGRILMNHAFGGNIRQLRNVLQRAAHAGSTVVIDDEALGVLEQAPQPRPSAPAPAAGADDDDDRPERGFVPPKTELEAALVEARGNVAEAARKLGTYPRQLYRWLSRSGVDVERFRDTTKD